MGFYTGLAIGLMIGSLVSVSYMALIIAGKREDEMMPPQIKRVLEEEV